VARAVYSQSFINYTADTPNSSFGVPEGYTAVIRQVSCWQNIGAYDFQCLIQDSAEAPKLVIWGVTDVSVNDSEDVEGRWVVPELGVISIFSSAVGSAPCFYVGGYLLQNAPAD